MGIRFVQSGASDSLVSANSRYSGALLQRHRWALAIGHIVRCWVTATLVTSVMNSLGNAQTTNSLQHIAKEDLTVKECLAQARKERHYKNWVKAITYYEQLEKEYGGGAIPDRETLTYRLEWLECLLIAKQHSASVKLIELICSVPNLPPELISELLFEKGKSEYEQHRYGAARTTLLEGITKASGKIRTFRCTTTANEAHLLVAQCLIAENHLNEAISHLETRNDLDPQTNAIGLALKARIYLGLRHPEPAMEVLKTNLSRLRSWNLPASCDELLLETATHFCASAEPEKSIECLMLTADPTITSQAIQQHIRQLELQINRPSKDPKAVQRLYESRRVLSILSNELRVLKPVAEQKLQAIKTAADAFISQGRFRDAAVLLRTAPVISSLCDETIADEMRWKRLVCLQQMQRWDDVTKAADSLMRGDTEPRIRLESTLLKGIALSKSDSHASAIQTFQTIFTESEGTPCASRARILCASTQLQSGDPLGAIRNAISFISTNPKHPLSETAHYLLTAAQLAAKQHTEALRSTTAYLRDRSNTENREAMYVYKAKAQLGLGQQKAAADTLRLFLAEYQDGDLRNEARLLLGKTLLFIGDAYEGFENLKTVTLEDPALFDESRLQLAKALLSSSRPKDAEEILTDFVKVRIDSARLGEACRALIQTGNANHTRDEALETLWSLIGHPGRNCHNPFANEIITSLENAYIADGRLNEFHHRLSDKTATQLSLTSQTAMHCHCSIALLWAAWKLSHRADPDNATADLAALETAANQMPSMVAPGISSELAKALETGGEPQRALAVWRELLKWNPQSQLKDSALLTLGSAAALNGDIKKALSLFDRFEGECKHSALMPEMLLYRASAHARNNDEQKQLDDLTGIAAAKTAPIKIRAQALVELGDLKIHKHEYSNAIVYLQRAYITCLASRDLAARAYERCAFAFEQLHEPDAAAKLYAELIDHPDLRHTPAANECRSRPTIASGF